MLYFMLHELKYYFRNIKEAIYIYGLFISIVVLLPFGVEEGEIARVAPVGLWIALACCVSLGGATLFQRDSDEGRLEYYQLLPMPLEQLLLAKWVAFFLFIAIPLLAMLPFAGLLLAIPPENWLHYALGLLAGAGALSALAALASVVAVGLEKAGAALSLMILPLSIPVMIFGVEYCRHIDIDWQPSLLFILGFCCLLLPIYCSAGASCIRAAH